MSDKSSTSDSDESMTSNSDDSHKKSKSKKHKKKSSHKSKRKEKKHEKRKGKKKKRDKDREKCRRKKHKKEKEHKCKTDEVVKDDVLNDEDIGPELPPNLPDNSRTYAPMSKEQWEAKQKEVKRVYDKETGRYRLIRGTGEILEEIVSKERHKEINKQATQGDGEYFQSVLSRK